MKVLIFGNHTIARECTEILRKRNDVEIIGFVGCDTDLDKTLGYPSLKKYCNQKNIPYIHADDLNFSIDSLTKNQEIDFCFSFYYRKVFDTKTLSMAKNGFINIHPSLLPKYRGPIPSMWAILNGEKITGTTMHYIDKGIDTGNIIAQKEISISPTISGFALQTIIMKEGIRLFRQNINTILTKKIEGTKQDNSEASYYGPFKETLRLINWYQPSSNIINKILAFTHPYAGAIAKIDKNILFIWSAKKIVNLTYQLKGPGKIIEVKKDRTLIVTTVDGLLAINSYEFENKNDKDFSMLSKKFLLT